MNNLNDIRNLAIQLMTQHGLVSSGWKFVFGRGKAGMGRCSYTHKTIKVHAYHAENSPLDEVKDTILHELAHALVGIGDRNSKPHGWLWKMKCREIGARPERCGHIEVSPAGKWVADCHCGIAHHNRYRRPKRMIGWRCRVCGQSLIWRLADAVPEPLEIQSATISNPLPAEMVSVGC